MPIVHVVKIAFLDLPKKVKSVIFQETQRFVLKSKNNLRLQVKLSTENSYFWDNISYFDELQNPIKGSSDFSFDSIYLSRNFNLFSLPYFSSLTGIEKAS